MWDVWDVWIQYVCLHNPEGWDEPPPYKKKLAEVINLNVRFWRQFGRFICFKALVFHLTKSQVLNRRDWPSRRSFHWCLLNLGVRWQGTGLKKMELYNLGIEMDRKIVILFDDNANLRGVKSSNTLNKKVKRAKQKWPSLFWPNVWLTVSPKQSVNPPVRFVADTLARDGHFVISGTEGFKKWFLRDLKWILRNFARSPLKGKMKGFQPLKWILRDFAICFAEIRKIWFWGGLQAKCPSHQATATGGWLLCQGQARNLGWNIEFSHQSLVKWSTFYLNHPEHYTSNASLNRTTWPWACLSWLWSLPSPLLLL